MGPYVCGASRYFHFVRHSTSPINPSAARRLSTHSSTTLRWVARDFAQACSAPYIWAWRSSNETRTTPRRVPQKVTLCDECCLVLCSHLSATSAAAWRHNCRAAAARAALGTVYAKVRRLPRSAAPHQRERSARAAVAELRAPTGWRRTSDAETTPRTRAPRRRSRSGQTDSGSAASSSAAARRAKLHSVMTKRTTDIMHAAATQPRIVRRGAIVPLVAQIRRVQAAAVRERCETVAPPRRGSFRLRGPGRGRFAEAMAQMVVT